jgi:UDP-glucose 4-epimerase
MKKVFVIGGLGHIGLTLASILGKHYKILLMDSNEKAKIEFIEEKKAIFLNPILITF